MKQIRLYVLFSLFTMLNLGNILAQKQDPVLFTVNQEPVKVSEFKYIYTKTNGKKADFSKASLEEYLDLYTKFKLKVARAREMKLDTIQALKEELEGYRKQLADSYLMDKEILSKLVKEVYDRKQKDMDVSHILIAMPRNAGTNDTIRAWEKVLEVKKKLSEGAPFEIAAKEYSMDEITKDKGGHIGYLTAMLPSGFYRLETAIYTADPGTVTGPVRSPLGYHLIRVNDAREARGEMEVSHILIRKPKAGTADDSKRRIDEIYEKLKGGSTFEDLAMQFSEDKATVKNGGKLGRFGINKYERNFEDAAFALQKNGDYSAPVETSLGWHIIRRDNKPAMEAFEVVEPALENQVKRDERFTEAKVALISRLKNEYNYTFFKQVLMNFARSLDTSFFKTTWRVNPDMDGTLFILENTKFSLADFQKYLQDNARLRSGMQRGNNPESAVFNLYNNYADDMVLKYEMGKLEDKYPDFSALMREYREGILLFEATKINVWDKASQDTVGLTNYYNTQMKGRYKWDERAQVSIYSLKKEAEPMAEKIRAAAKKQPAEKVLKKFNKPGKEWVTVTEKTYEKGKNKTLDEIKPWSDGAVSALERDLRDSSLNFIRINKVIAGADKTVDEARGYAVAEYQNFLEKSWIEELRKKFRVEVNKEVFNSLIGKRE